MELNKRSDNWKRAISVSFLTHSDCTFQWLMVALHLLIVHRFWPDTHQYTEGCTYLPVVRRAVG